MSREHNDMTPFVEAIERKYPEIELDYKDKKKERHWSWYLMPLLKEEGMKPRAGTEIFYLDDDDEIKAYLDDRDVQKYYKEFLDVLHHVVVDGKRERNPMTPAQSLKAYLQPVDYDKFVKHVDSFYPFASGGIQKLYDVFRGDEEPDMDKFPNPRVVAPKKLVRPKLDLPFGKMGRGMMPFRSGKRVQSIKMNVPLFIRMMEYAKEDAKTDMDLHRATERAIHANHGRTLSMKNYDSIVGWLLVT